MKTETVHVLEKDILEYLGIKELPQDYELYIGSYELREWSFGEREKIIGASSVQRINSKTGEIDSTLNSAKFRLNVMQSCIKHVSSMKSAPTASFLNDMPTWLGEALWEKINALNDQGIDGEEAKKFSLS